MRRPLLPAGLLMIAGILCAEWLRPPLPLMFGLSFAVAAAALAWSAARPWLLCLLLFLTGWIGACWHSTILSPNDLRLLLGSEPRLVTLRGTIQAPPSERIFEQGQREFWHSSALLEADAILTNGIWQPVAGRVVAAAQGVLASNIFAGQQVEVSGVIELPRGPYARGMFNPREFYRRENVFFQLQTSGPGDWNASPARPPISERFRHWATNTLAIGLPPGEDEALRLTWTLLLDWKAPLTGSVEEPFMRAGTYHIFAVDGLRIGLWTVIGIGLLRLLRIPRAICGALVLPGLWFYAALTGWPASAVRAAIMASVVILGWVCRRPGDTINSLFAAAIVVLCWDPSQLFQPGFQLSFVVVLCIAIMVPRVQEMMRRWIFPSDPFLPASLRPRRPVWISGSMVFALDTFAVSVAAWVGSIALAAYYFNLFTPVSVPANCVVVPAAALALMSGMASLLTGAWLPALAGLFNNATWALMKFIIWFSRWAAQAPGGSFNVAAPPVSVCVFYYALLLLVVTGWIFRSRHKWPVAAALLAFALGGTFYWMRGLGTARLDILPLEGAPAVAAGKFLIDCGSEQSAGQFLKPFLRAQGVNRLRGLCLPVGRLPYFGGARLILTNFPAREIFAGAAHDRSAAFRGLEEELSRNRNWRTVKDGVEADGWTVLHPGPADQFAQADDNAVVLWRVFNGHSVLLMPALGRDGQDALMRRRPELRAEFVVAGLPARDEPLCEPLLDQLQPRVIIVADAQFPATRRASAKLRERLARRSAKVFYGRDNGSLTLEISEAGWSLREADGSEAALPARAD
ncbi:MAG TPA: ComEC/Rec2 family competence protein [Verrucomicrobiae bacterium]|jgi:ComEC/Rec2-related protein